MIRYHGGPITPMEAAIEAWNGTHAMISFARPDQVTLATEIAHSFALDNGAFSAWKANHKTNWNDYSKWVQEWRQHPGFDFALIPDEIEGSEQDNDELIRWFLAHGHTATYLCPVWHMHESVSRLRRLVVDWPRVAIGSSGQFAEVGTMHWWLRIAQAMEIACDENGRPRTRLHGLRQMDPTVFSHIPYSSVDSTMIARTIGRDHQWAGTYQPMTRRMRAAVLRERIEFHASAVRWIGTGGVQANLELVG